MRSRIRSWIDSLVRPSGAKFISEREYVDVCKFEYSSQEDYRHEQVLHHVRKFDQVWADTSVVEALAEYLMNNGIPATSGLCHGSRNGWEQRRLSEILHCQVIGTDIASTVEEVPSSVVWDFHEARDEWLGAFSFVYSNSLDQSNDPQRALRTWLDQLAPGGVLFIEWTEGHGPVGASSMDPFGVRSVVLPYFLLRWFGRELSIDVLSGTKSNLGIPYLLFAIQRAGPESASGWDWVDDPLVRQMSTAKSRARAETRSATTSANRASAWRHRSSAAKVPRAKSEFEVE